MKYWKAGWACVLAVLVALPLACGGGGGESQQPPAGLVIVPLTPTGQVTPRPRKTAAPSPTPTASPLKVCATNPDPASPKLLQVGQPLPEQQVKIPFYVSGWGSNIGFQDTGVALSVVDAKQTVLQSLDLPPQPREFRVAPPGLEITDFTRPFGADIVVNNVKEPTPYCLWVYQETTETGQPKGVVQVPVLVLP
ncbi:MAG: hypothetical protein Q7T33_04925 [Dehalococcoidia bacterium]|nr:hypothetical protein [Dehalococcoidia bacterium]